MSSEDGEEWPEGAPRPRVYLKGLLKVEIAFFNDIRLDDGQKHDDFIIRSHIHAGRTPTAQDPSLPFSHDIRRPSLKRFF